MSLTGHPAPCPESLTHGAPVITGATPPHLLPNDWGTQHPSLQGCTWPRQPLRILQLVTAVLGCAYAAEASQALAHKLCL